MRTTTIRTAILVLLLVCGLPAVAAANASTDRIYTDCEHSASGNQTGSYTKAQLNTALENPPGDVSEYSGCYDAIKQALLAGKHSSNGGGNGSGAPGGGSAGAGGGSQSGGTGADARAAGAGGTAGSSAPPTAHASGSKQPVQLAGSSVQPGVVPTLGKDSSALPTPLIVFLVLLGAGAVALGATEIGRRVLARRRA